MPGAGSHSVADVRDAVDAVVRDAVARGASDVHLEPVAAGYELRYRVDGILEVRDRLDGAVGRAMVSRLMVLGQLLTYRLDVPQEGRVVLPVEAGAEGRGPLKRSAPGAGAPLPGAGAESGELPGAGAGAPLPGAIEMRLAVMPTTHGLRAVLRLPAELTQPRTLEELGLPAAVESGLRRFAGRDDGMLLLTGPAGSGKTTTIYALLEYMARTAPGLSIVSLEDPVERDLPGVTQIEVSPFGQLTYERALRSMLRQDPQVLMIGEVRDAATASLAVQATLSGHRLITTLHAGTPGGAIARLLEMGLEPYQVASALYGVVAQRLARRKVEGAGPGVEGEVLGATPPQLRSGGLAGELPGAGAGYRGRFPIAELARVDAGLREAVLARRDARAIDALLRQQPGHVTLHEAARQAVRDGRTDEAEIVRIFGDDVRHADPEAP